jgi:hypothetical protein
LTIIARFARVATVCVLAAELSFSCSIIEVTVPPVKVGRNVAITVVEKEKPAHDVRVSVESLKNSEPHAQMGRPFQATTNANGEASLTGLATGLYVVYAIKNDEKTVIGSLDVSSEITASPSHAKFELYPPAPLPPPPPAPIVLRSIRGRVIDPSGAVVANTKFKVSHVGDAPGTPKLELATNTRGEVSSTVPDGNYEITFGLPGFSTAHVPVTVSATSDKSWSGFALTLLLAECTTNPNPYHYSIAEEKN